MTEEGGPLEIAYLVQGYDWEVGKIRELAWPTLEGAAKSYAYCKIAKYEGKPRYIDLKVIVRIDRKLSEAEIEEAAKE